MFQGLLSGMDDPQKMMLMMMGARMLEGAPGRQKNFGADLSHGLLGGLQAYQGAQSMQMRQREEEERRQMREMQMRQMQEAQQRQTSMRDLATRAFAPPQPLDPRQQEGGQQEIPGGGGMPEFARGMMGIDPMQAIPLMQSLQPKPKIQFAPDGRVVDMNALTPGESFAKQPDWKDPEYEKVQARIRAAGRPQVTTNVMPPREVFKDSMALKKDFDAQPEVKGFKEVQHAWDQISTALQNPSAANDLAAATKFMKLLDPGSVVRESELAMAMQASGALDRMANYHKRLLKGEKLTPQQREDFFSAGQALYEAAKGRFGETVTQYDGIAKQYGLDPQFIPKAAAPKLQKNQTAIYKAKEAIKRGADPEAVKKRLMEAGYDPAGL